MSNNISLTREQVFFVTFLGILGNIVYIHTWIDDAADRAAWISIFLGIVFIIPFALWILYLGKLNPRKTIFEMLQTGIGKYPTKFFIFIYMLINIAVATTQLNMFTQMLKSFFLVNTPSAVIMLILLFLCILFTKKEFIIYARLVEVLAAVALMDYFTSYTFALMGLFHTKYVFPIFVVSPVNILKSALFISGNASELLLLLIIIIPYIQEPIRHYKWVLSGIISSGIVFSLAVFIINGIMSPEIAKTIAYGGVNVAFLIQIGDYIRGLEVLVFGTYQFIAIGKVSACIYCMWTSSKKLFTPRAPNFQIYLCGLFLLIPSIGINSYNNSYFIAVFLSNYVTLPFSILLLLLATICTLINNVKNGSVSR